MMKIIVLDTETTAVDPPIGVVELAWVELDENLEVVTHFSSLIDPEIPITCGAAGVNRIRQERIDQENPPTLDEVTWPDGEILLICHNVKFDKPLVEKYMNIVEDLCTYLTSRRLLPDSENHKLQTLWCYCDLPDEEAHQALGDVMTVVHLLKYLLEGADMSLEEMVAYANTPVIMELVPFGKHKGKRWKNISSDYMRWILGEDFDDDTVNTVNYHLNKRRGR